MASDQILNDGEQNITSAQYNLLRLARKNLKGFALVIIGIIVLFAIGLLLIPVLNKGVLRQESILRKTFDPKAPHVSDQLIVRLKGSYTREELESLKRKFDELGVVSQKKVFASDDSSLRNFYILQFKKGTDIKKVGQELSVLKEIEEVQPNYLYVTQEIPSDPYYGQQWNLDKVSMPKAWDLIKGSNSVIIAVVDSGIDYNHQDFSGRNIIRGPDFCPSRDPSGECLSSDNDPLDRLGHGTHVAGVIGAVTNNNIGISGINWNVTFMAVKVTDDRGYTTSSTIAKGIEYAVNNGAKVINLSIGTPPGEVNPCRNDPLQQKAVNKAIERGSVVVASAGNSGIDAGNSSPGSCNGVITVGASTRLDARWSRSNYGARVNIAAPGTEINSTITQNAYGYKTGTSMATPHVSGVIGLLLAARPDLSKDQILSCLVNGADPISTDKSIGNRLNAFGAIKECSPVAITTPTIASGISPTAVPTPTMVSITPKITGIVLVDNNSNEIIDADDTGQGGIELRLEGPKNGSATSDSLGRFEFLDLPLGRYKVSLIQGGIPLSLVNVSLAENTIEYKVTFLISPFLLTSSPQASGPPPTPIIIGPTIVTKPTSALPTKTVQTYTCRDLQNTEKAKPGSLKIGSLICEPN